MIGGGKCRATIIGCKWDENRERQLCAPSLLPLVKQKSKGKWVHFVYVGKATFKLLATIASCPYRHLSKEDFFFFFLKEEVAESDFLGRNLQVLHSSLCH